jgi:hypothetical protein
MTGPNVLTRNYKNYSQSSQEEDDEDDQPWDAMYNSRIMTKKTNTTTTAPNHNSEEDGDFLEDGDLPSLSTTGRTPATAANASTVTSSTNKNNNYTTHIGGRIVGGQRTTTRPLKAPNNTTKTTTASTNHNRKSVSPIVEERKKFWGQLDHHGEEEDDDEDRDPPNKSKSPKNRSSAIEDNVPDDEIAANRRSTTTTAHGKPTSNNHHATTATGYDTDYSAPTVDESQVSQVTEAVVIEEDSAYESTFCGHTLNAIKDMCGGTLTNTIDGGTTSSNNNNKPNMALLTSPRAPTEQQEHTAIEVEFVEQARPPPPQEEESTAMPTLAERSVSGSTTAASSSVVSSSQRKNAYLSAIAKKAKENFRAKQNKKKKKKKKGIPQSLSSEMEDDHHDDDGPEDEQELVIQPEQVKQWLSSSSQSSTSAANIGLSSTMSAEQQEQSVTVDDDYDNFTPAEKRKFIKLVNGGVTAVEATRIVTEERVAAVERERAMLKKLAQRAAMQEELEESQGEHTINPTPTAAVAATAKTTQPIVLSKSDESLDSALNDGNVEEPEYQADKGTQLHQESETYGGMPLDGSRMGDDDDDDVDDALLDNAADATFTAKKSIADEAIEAVNSSDLDKSVDSIPFERSGHNYYDAVRRDLDVEASPSPRGRRPAPKILREPFITQRLFGGRHRGFEPISDAAPVIAKQRSISAPRTRPYALQDSPSPFPGPPKAQSEVAFGAGDLLAVSRAMASSREQQKLENVNYQIPTAPRAPEAIPEASPEAAPSSFDYGKKSSPNDSEISEFQPFAFDTQSPHSEIKQKHVPQERMIRSLSPPTARPQDREMVPEKKRTNAAKARSKSVSPPTVYETRIFSSDRSADMSMDTYFHSTAEGYSASGGNFHSDNMSVYTAGTNLTSGTNYTKSSRVRRPGAAKTRLAKQKQLEQQMVNKKQGWHETIRAVAESTNHVWDPKRGWVDYTDPEIHIVIDETAYPDKYQEKIHLGIDRKVLSRKTDGGGSRDGEVSTGPKVQVPFPEEWEKERESMIGTLPEKPLISANEAVSSKTKGDKQQAGLKVKPKMSTTESFTDSIYYDLNESSLVGEREIEASDAEDLAAEGTERGISSRVPDARSVADESHSTTGSKSKGWIESMRAASAALAEQGRIWDPAHGWTVIDKDGRIVPNVVDFDAETEKPKQETLLTATVDDAPRDREMGAAPSEAKEEIERDLRVPVPLPPRSTGKKLDAWVEKSGQVSKKQSELSTASSNKAVASTENSAHTEQGESFRRFATNIAGDSTAHTIAFSGENMNKKAFPAKEGNNDFSDDETEDDDHGKPLVNQSGAFPSLNDRPLSSVVDVRKVKVDEEDLDFFARDTKNADSSRSMSSRLMNVSAERSNQGPLSVSGTPSSRRGAGPIDVDEVDEKWDSDDEDRHSRSWPRGSVASTDISEEDIHIQGWKELASSKTPNASPPVVDHGKKSGSSERSKPRQNTSPGRKVPKLAPSKRDTSPVSTHRLPEEDSELPSNDSINERSRSRDNDVISTPYHGRPDRPSPIEAEPQLQRELFTSQPNTVQSPKLEAERTYDHGMPNSPTVKARLQEWETRIEASHSYEAEELIAHSPKQMAKADTTPSTAEWKSFLKKKVEEETAAAAGRLKLKSGATAEAKEPEGEYSRYTKRSIRVVQSTDDDSLFQFPSSIQQTGITDPGKSVLSSLNLSEVSPIDKKSEFEEFEQGSEAYGPAAGEQRSFLQRLSECAAPIMPTQRASLGPTGSRFAPPALCGKEDSVDDRDESMKTSQSINAYERQHMRSSSFGDDKPRSKPSSRSRLHPETMKVSTSSVVSEDFGAKSAYLEAIARKTAVSKPRPNSRRRGERSIAGSSVATNSTAHSERWKEFLDKKKAAGASPVSSRASDADVTRAAEKYANDKVNELMAKMSSNRAKSVTRSREVHREIDSAGSWSNEPIGSSPANLSKNKGQPVRAAEDLAAARVEAMIAALSGNQVEGEI